MSTLSTILRRGIGLQLEAMQEPTVERLAETLVAFANADGGTVLLGVDAKGEMTGRWNRRRQTGMLRARWRSAGRW